MSAIAEATGPARRRAAPTSGGRLWVSILALAVTGLLFGQSYVLLPLLSLAQRLDLHGLLMGGALPWLVGLLRLPQIVFFGSLAGYLLASLVTVALLLAALVWGRPGPAGRVVLALGLLAVAAFPWLSRYRPALGPASGYRMQLATAPGLLEGVIKQTQVAREIRPCRYSLLGWSQEGVLYYQGTCAGKEPQVWAYDPVVAQGRAIAIAPAALVQQPPVVSPLEQVRASVYPRALEPSVRRLALHGSALTSPDGRWLALVAGHLYGPEDVLVLEHR
ncbi:MAG: hypothetical protein HPY83_09145 [Anaerolineae bacterium]|nr:hypothetical protein [Anaerolineae bacterium]